MLPRLFLFIDFVFKVSGLLRMMCDAPSAVSIDADSKKRPLQDLDTTDSKKQCTEADRVKRRKVALLLAYSGQGYLGMQRLVLLHQCNIIYHIADEY
jgi:hypothetical protein